MCYFNFHNHIKIERNTKKMKFFSWIKKGIRFTDLFYTSELLRFNDEMEYRTLTGGLISLAIIIAVVIGFANMIIGTLNLSSITFIQTTSQETDPSSGVLSTNPDGMFMMAVELWGINLTETRYFDVIMIQLQTANGQTQYNYTLIPLEQCTIQHWSAFPEIASQYYKLSMSNWLCPPIGTDFTLQGKYSSDFYNYVNISVNPCTADLDPSSPCPSSAQVKQLFLDFNDAIMFKIYYTNPIINAGDKNYKSYYLETSNYADFGSYIGGQNYIYVSSYTINTDQSIWPYSSNVVDQGLMIQPKIDSHPFTTFYGSYSTYLIVKSSSITQYDRQVNKISDVFAFVGGLISSISAALFILKYYNSLAFEVTIGLSLFKPPQEHKEQIGSLSINLFLFIKYYFYRLADKIGKKLEWPSVAFVKDCQQESLKQLDVKALIKRVIFLEYCITQIFQDYQLEGLQLKKPATPQEIRKIRQKCQSIDAFYQNEYESQNNISNSQNSSNHQKNTIFQMRDPVQIDVSPSNLIANTEEINQQACSKKQRKGFTLKRASKEQLLKDNKQNLRVSELSNNDLERRFDDLNSFKPLKNRKVFRQSCMGFLKQSANGGNQLSMKIWQQLKSSNIKQAMQIKRKSSKLNLAVEEINPYE